MKDFKMSLVPILKTLADYPTGSSCPSFHITEGNAGWRVYRPLIRHERCVGCHRCYLVCPDAAIHKNDEQQFVVDYDFCKGCGVCAYECKPKAIDMIKEGSHE